MSENTKLRERNELIVIRNLLGIGNTIPVEDAVNNLIAERNSLRAALERIANRLPEKWPDQAIARTALNEETNERA